MMTRFDVMAAALARARTRRAWIVALTTGMTGIILGNAGSARAGQVSAAPSCRGKRSKCRQGGQCCSGRCRKRQGKKKGRCRCSGFLKPCRKSSDCCSLSGSPLVCVNGSCET